MAVWSKVMLSNLGHASRIEAEYYRPEYLEMENKLKLTSAKPMTQFLHYLTDGTHITPKYVENGVPFLSSSDVDPFLLPFIIDKFISGEEHNRLKHCQPSAGDILMSKSGRIGSCAVVPKNIRKGDWNIYEGIALLKMTGIDPHYTVSFLNSEYGNFQIRRELKGVAQPHLHLEDIRRLRIFIPGFSEVSKTRELVIKGTELAKESHQLYINAQHLLESELGLDKLNFQKPVGYTARFSELEQSRRLDSEHFFPAFQNLVVHLPDHINLVPLGNQLNFCQRGKQPLYSKHGLPVVNSKHVQRNKVVLEGNRAAIFSPIADLQIRYGDILMNGTGRGTIGRVAPYLADKQAIPDNHVTILRSSTLDPAYLSFYLNSQAGQLQVEMHQRGTSGQLELYPFDIRKFLVWVAPDSLQKEIRRLYDQAAASEQRSRELLNQAKTRVEQLIEEAVRS